MFVKEAWVEYSENISEEHGIEKLNWAKKRNKFKTEGKTK
jgi:hypothetical protein